jgi:two-component system LytT family response regulator
MRVLIVDDEPLARRRIRALLRDANDVVIVGECGDGNEAIEAVNREKPDVVFLDVQLPGVDGFGVLNKVDPTILPVVIFVTAYDRYAIHAFEVHALDYLLKPFDKLRFHQALERARDQIHKSDAAAAQLLRMLQSMREESHGNQRILVKSTDRSYFVFADDIDWVESTGNYVTLHTGKTAHLLRETMKGMEQRLDPRSFRRIHRQVIVNVNRIRELRSWFHGDYRLTMHDGTVLSVSRRYRRNLDGAL